MVPSGCRTAMMSMAPLRCGVTYANVLPTAMPAANVPLYAAVKEASSAGARTHQLDIVRRAGIRTRMACAQVQSKPLAWRVANRGADFTLQAPAAPLALSERPALPSMVVELALASELTR